MPASRRRPRTPLGRRRDRGTGRDHALAPGLADEFFKRGVRAYIGTAWSIADDAAVRFAGQFYQHLLLQNPAAKSPRRHGEWSSAIGHAVFGARTKLWKERSQFGLAWAVYQLTGIRRCGSRSREQDDA